MAETPHDYLQKYGVEAALRVATATVIRNRPSNPLAAISENLKTAATGILDLSGESYDNHAPCKVGYGMFSVCTAHKPAMMEQFIDINNRAWIFEINDKVTGDFLLVYGLPSCKKALPKVKAIMSATGLTVRYVVTSGDAHHLYLEDWLEEETFAATKFFMTGVKFPTTRNGKKLLAKPQHKVRIELIIDQIPEALEKYTDQVQFYLNTQYTIYEDQEGVPAYRDSIVKAEDMPKFTEIVSAPFKTRFACINVYHPPTKTLSVEHNFDFFFPQQVYDQFPAPIRQLFRPEVVRSHCGNLGCVCDATKNWVENKRLLGLDVRFLVDMHVPPTFLIRYFPTQADYISALTQVFESSGEANDGANLPSSKLVSSSM